MHNRNRSHNLAHHAQDPDSSGFLGLLLGDMMLGGCSMVLVILILLANTQSGLLTLAVRDTECTERTACARRLPA